MKFDLPQEINDRYATAKNEYTQLKREAESKVVRWQWATGPMFEPDTYYFEEIGLKRGKWLKEAPETPRYKYCYGFDAQDQIVVGRSDYVQFNEADGFLFNERFFFAKAGFTDTFYFSYATKQEPNRLINFTRYIYEDSRLIQTLRTALAGYSVAQFYYDNNGLLIQKQQHNQRTDNEDQSFEETYNYRHGIDGSLELIESSYGAVVYRKTPKALSLKKLNELAENKVVEEIIKAIKSNAPQHSEPVYALFLMYGSDEEAMPPPMMYLARESYRQERLKDDPDSIWNPNEFEGYDAGDMMFDYDELSEQTLELFSLYNQEISSLDSDTMFYKCIAGIGKRVKSAIESDPNHLGLTLTPDFVVAPMHYEGHDIKKNLKAINPEQFKLLKNI